MRSAVIAFAILLCQTVSSTGQEPALRSVWYRFEAEDDLGAGVGRDVWPAHPLYATSAPGRVGRGLALPGRAGNGLYLPNPVSFFGSSARAGTVALWVQPAEAPGGVGQQVLFDFMRQTGNTLIDGYEIVLFVDGAQLKAKPNLDRQMAIDNPLKPGVWTHLALAWDSESGAALYVDGAKVAERQGAFTPIDLEPGWPGRIGCHTPSGGYPFRGAFDELRLFDRRLTDDEVRALLTLDTADDRVGAISEDGRRYTVHNGSDRPVPVVVQVWRPARHAALPLEGYLPFPFAAAPPERRFFVAGAMPVETLGEPLEAPAGRAANVLAPEVSGELGPTEVRIVVGDGIGARQVAGRRSQGLRVVFRAHEPLQAVAGEPLRIGLRAYGDLGRTFEGAILAELVAADGAPVATDRVDLRLPTGRVREFDLHFPARPVVGEHEVRLSAIVGQTITPLNRASLFVTAPGDARTLTDVAASYVHPANDEATLAAMARDGVVAVRLHGGIGDYYNHARNLTAVLRAGLKAWRMPAASYRSVCVDPARRAELVATATHLGAYLRDQPAVVNQVIAGEGLSCPPCYCDACTESFRTELRRVWGDLARLNRAWGSAYQDWSAIQQLGSPADLDETAERLKMMKVALELPAENQARWRKLYELDPPRALAWKRWHEAKLVAWYRAFAEAFAAANGGATPLSEQPCWPNFESHVLFALGEIADLGGMDLYLPGEGPTTLGYVAELMLNFDANASIFGSRGKPLMVHELYLQDNSPERLPEAQGWWLVGRGYGLLSYFTYDYYYEGVRNNQPLIFGLFDKEGAAYPTYPSFLRFGQDVKRFAAAHTPSTLRREIPRVALFLGDDMSLVNNLETGGATWEAAGVHGHNGAYWLTERSGFPVEFVNDDGLANVTQSVLVVPWSHVIRASSLRAVLDFARRGGVVLIDGPIGLRDEHNLPYDPLPGGPAAAALGLRIGGYEDRENRIVLPDGTALASRGVPADVSLAGARVLMNDADGRPALVERTVGRGKVLWFLTSLGRTNLSRAPQPQAVSLWRSLLSEHAGLTPRWRFEPAADAPAGKKGAVLDVSFRLRGDGELYAFVVSFFEASRGELRLDLPAGEWTAEDALTGLPIALHDGAVAMDLPADGHRVLRLRGAGLSGW